MRDVCLDGTAFVSLVKANSNAALEVLLAICIEEPKHDDYMSSSAMEDYGLAFWHAGEPPMYFRGPFLQFMREAPEQGLTFALRLINFATARCVGKQRWGVTVRVTASPSSGLAITASSDGTMTGLGAWRCAFTVGSHGARTLVLRAD